MAATLRVPYGYDRGSDPHRFELHATERRGTMHGACGCGWTSHARRREAGLAYLDWRQHTARVAVQR